MLCRRNSLSKHMLPSDCQVYTTLSNFLKCIPCFPFPPSSSFVLPSLLLPIEEFKRRKISKSCRKCNVHEKHTFDHTVGREADLCVSMLMTINNLNLQSELFSLKGSKPTYDITLRTELHRSRSCRSWPHVQSKNPLQQVNWVQKVEPGEWNREQVNPTCLCHTFGCFIFYFFLYEPL